MSKYDDKRRAVFSELIYRGGFIGMLVAMRVLEIIK